MIIGKLIKRTVQVFAALGLLALFGYPLAGAWLERHPDTERALSIAADNVDSKAGFFTRTQQFVSGVSKSRENAAEDKRERAEDKALDEAERKEREMRNFNTGGLAREDY